MPAAPIMSINSDVSPLPASSSAREEQAKVAGHVIYNSVHGAADNTRIPPPVSAPVLPSFSDPDMGGPSGPAPLTASLAADPMSEGRMSSVRRTFCLFVLFDLILMFILWVIYAQLIGDTGYKAFEKEVQNYTFASSLFDSVMLSAVRFTFLLLAYALYRSGHWWMVAFTTALTCGVLIAKIFLFDFEGSKSNNNPLSYCIIIISFVLAWVETWFLDFKVLPHEKKLMSRLAASTGRGYGSTYTSQGYRTFSNDDMQSVITEDNQFYSPLDSPEGSDTESDVKESRGAVGGAVAARGLSRQASGSSINSRHFEVEGDGLASRFTLADGLVFKKHSLPQTGVLKDPHPYLSSSHGIPLYVVQPRRVLNAFSTPQGAAENDYVRLARHSWEVLWTYITSPESDWKSESGSSIEAGVVHSKKVKGVGKVFRLTTLIEWSPKATYEAVNFQPETQPQWNSALKESQIATRLYDL
ncbi:uncharacterized protein LOC101862583 [Aplysia californica]|uniref:Uncharacterized protein LOC101862583 n=1 Tax=Aplysia californica TaxID=6500 RepID=A0ABM1VTY0_APLCA|nr:uncharacterized protein LOC101862583 [Aplysia californica]